MRGICHSNLRLRLVCTFDSVCYWEVLYFGSIILVRRLCFSMINDLRSTVCRERIHIWKIIKDIIVQLLSIQKRELKYKMGHYFRNFDIFMFPYSSWNTFHQNICKWVVFPRGIKESTFHELTCYDWDTQDYSDLCHHR